MRRNSLWLILILPVLLGGLIYGGFYLSVKSKIDDIILIYSPRAKISYDRLRTQLNGQIDIYDIEIIPLGQNHPIKIDRIAIRTQPVWEYILQHNPITGEEGPPNPFAMEIGDIEINLTESLAKSLDKWEEETLSEYDQSLDMCRPGGGINFNILRKLGFVDIFARAEFRYQFMPENRRFHLQSSIDIRDMVRFDGEIELANITPNNMDNWLTIALAKLNIRSHTHPILGQRVSAFCAAKLGMRKKEYHRLRAVEFVHDLAGKGILLGQGLKKAVQDYFTNWGRIEITLNPRPPINLLTLVNLRPSEIEKRLGLNITLDDKLVTDLSFELKKELLLPKKENNKNRKKVLVKKWVYESVPLQQLERYVGRMVQLKNNEGIVYEGHIVEINPDVVSVEKRLSGGRFVAHLSRRKLVAAKVRVKKKVWVDQ